MAVEVADVERFARRVFREFSSPYPQTITDDVFCKIEENPEFRDQYDLLLGMLGEHTVHTEIGKFVKRKTGLKPIGQERNCRSTLIKSYTKLG